MEVGSSVAPWSGIWPGWVGGSGFGGAGNGGGGGAVTQGG
jgi:hypothetical protein